MRSKIMALIFILFALPAYAVNWTFTDNVTINGRLIVVDNTINGADLVDNTLNGAKITDNTITNAKFIDNTINGARILDNSISTSKLVNGTSFRGALSYVSSQNIDNATWTVISFVNETYDTDSIHSVTTDNTKLVVPAGVTRVRLTAQVAFSSDATGMRGAYMYKNNAGFIGSPVHYLTHVAYDNPFILITPVLTVSAGDYFTVKGYQNSGSTLTLDQATWFAMEIIE